MPRALITGVAGFIGSHIADECLRQGYEVVGLDDLSGGFLRNVPNGARLVTGSITDAVAVDRLFDIERFDYVYHLAAYAAEGLSHFIRRFNYENNLLGSVNLINAAERYDVKCFVFTSSIAVYGNPPNLPVRETWTPNPIDPYGVAKYAVEMDLEAARQMFGLNYVIFRPANVYGPRQNIGDRYRNVIGIFMNQLMRGEPMTIFGDGSQVRAFCYVKDIVDPIVNSASMPNCYGQIFNIGSDTQTTVSAVARAVAVAMDKSPTLKFLPARHEAQRVYADHTKLGEYFTPLTQMKLHNGLHYMAQWALKVGPQKPTPFANIELTKNLPPSWR